MSGRDVSKKGGGPPKETGKTGKKSGGRVKKRLAAGCAVAVSLVLLVTRMDLFFIQPPREAPNVADLREEAIPWEEVWDEREHYSGQEIAVIGPVAGTAFVSSIEGKPTFINIGNPHPRTPRSEAIIRENSRPLFLETLSAPPEVLYEHHTICVAGTVEIHEGVPQIEIRDPAQIMTVYE